MISDLDIGIDEVGRGAWAGPLLVVAARLRSGQKLPPGLKDSKQLTASQRLKLVKLLKSSCQFGEGWVWPAELNRLKLSRSLQLAAKRALNSLQALPVENITIDGQINYCPAKYINVCSLVKADSQVPLVSAAAVWAKVRRDDYMTRLDGTAKLYSFAEHKGYGTKKHLDKLIKYRPSRHHRRFYRPVNQLLKP